MATDLEQLEALPAAPMVRFDPSQQRVFADDSRVIVVNFHRQKGKDFVSAAKAVEHALRTGQSWYIVSMTQRQADATFAKAVQFAKAFQAAFKMIGELRFAENDYIEYDQEIHQHFEFKSREMILPGGGRVISLPGRNPDTLAGLTGNVIFTEFGLFPGGGYGHWDVVFPLSTRGYQVMVISTPRGKNSKYFELWSDPETYSVHTCDIYKSVAEDGFVLRDNKGQPCSIEQFKKIYNSPAKWDREYGCKFTGDLETLITWSELMSASELGKDWTFRAVRIEGEAGWDENFFSAEHLPSGARLEIGWDVARTGHLSSVWVNAGQGSEPRRLSFLCVMHNTPFALQRHVIERAMNARGWGSGVGCGDSTGLGMSDNEALEKIYRERWEAVNFAGTRKGELAALGKATFRDRGLGLPPIDGEHKYIHTDLYAVQKIQDGEGNERSDSKRLKVEEGDNPLLEESHCDIAYSGFLALRAGAKNYEVALPAPSANKPIGW